MHTVEVEIVKIRRRIDDAQHSVDVEWLETDLLVYTLRQNNLEHITAEDVLLAATHLLKEFMSRNHIVEFTCGKRRRKICFHTPSKNLSQLSDFSHCIFVKGFQ